MELTDALRAEIEQNPMLEEVQSDDDSDSNPDSIDGAETKEIPEKLVTPQVEGEGASTVAEINWEDYSNNFDNDLSFSREIPPADAPTQFDFISEKPGLKAFLLWQLVHLKLDDLDTSLTRFIVENLEGHGFLEADIDDIVSCNNCQREEAEAALRLIHSLDPPGVGARDIRESLLLQLDRKGLEEPLAYQIIDKHINLLETRNFAKLARSTGATVRLVKEAVKVIRELTPYPGNEYSNEQTKYVVPDVFVYKIDDEFIIHLNDDDMPQLQVSEEYKTLLKQKNSMSKDSKKFLRENKRNAEWFIKSIQQRQRTIYKVVESLLKFQRDFFERGSGYLKPLILRDVAEDIRMHESTVSRITSNKYIHTPQGIYELKYFFSTAVATTDGDTVAAEAIKTRIRQLIAGEDPGKPLSDSKVSDILAEEKIKVARRTVAKYRDQLKILPVKHRRQART
jgi:RNA polymerase sigma-54 factor